MTEYLAEDGTLLNEFTTATVQEAERLANEYASNHVEHFSSWIYYVEGDNVYELVELDHK